MHETYANAWEAWKTDESESENAERSDQDEYAMRAVVEFLNAKYANMPASKTALEWELERTVLLMSFVGYLWYYQNDVVEVLASEVPFNLPLNLPRTGLPLPMDEVQRVGKIDHVVRWQGAICALERKSTSRSIDASSDYWDSWQKNTQVSQYALAFRDMDWSGVGIQPGERFGNTLADVWHKPTIRPAMLTQAATKEFIETGNYLSQHFEIERHVPNTFAEMAPVSVNGTIVEAEQGKKGFAIRETPEMFGVRLLQDIYDRPGFYFVRREISRTDKDLEDFKRQLFAVYTAQKAFAKSNCWFENESACRATFSCAYIPICYGPGADAVCDGRTTPPNFRRIFVDLTHEGQTIDAE
jgi:hypothetical protein